MPEEIHVDEAELNLKDGDAEDGAIINKALAVGSFFVGSIKWSSLVGDEKVMIHLEFFFSNQIIIIFL